MSGVKSGVLSSFVCEVRGEMTMKSSMSPFILELSLLPDPLFLMKNEFKNLDIDTDLDFCGVLK